MAWRVAPRVVDLGVGSSGGNRSGTGTSLQVRVILAVNLKNDKSDDCGVIETNRLDGARCAPRGFARRAVTGGGWQTAEQCNATTLRSREFPQRGDQGNMTNLEEERIYPNGFSG